MFGKSTTLKVQGMFCAHCEKRVQDAVTALGVQGCKASAKNGTVKVSGQLEEEMLQKVRLAITEAGYSVE